MGWKQSGEGNMKLFYFVAAASLLCALAHAEWVPCNTLEERERWVPRCSDEGMHDIDGLIRCDHEGYWAKGGHKRKDMEWCEHLKGPIMDDERKCRIREMGSDVSCEWGVHIGHRLWVSAEKAAEYRKAGWLP